MSHGKFHMLDLHPFAEGLRLEGSLRDLAIPCGLFSPMIPMRLVNPKPNVKVTWDNLLRRDTSCLQGCADQ